jgi:hypothetical protein
VYSPVPLFAVAIGPALLLYLFCLMSYTKEGFLRDEPWLLLTDLVATPERLRDYAQRLLALRREANSALDELKSLERGRLQLAANEYTCMFLLPTIDQFRRQFPEIGISVHRMLASRIAEELSLRTFEIGVTSFRLDPEKFRTIAVYNDSLAFIVSPRHRLAKAAHVSINDLGKENFIAHNVTSPLRLPSDIAGAVELLNRSDARSVITGAPARRSPYFNLVEERTDGSVGLAKSVNPPIVRRQDAPRCFDMNASIYVWRVAPFLESPAVFYPDTQLFEMPEERSVDIDSDLDFTLVELLLRKRLA